MARLPSYGQAHIALNESETSLREVISDLGFAALSKRGERIFREKLQRCIGQWWVAIGQHQDDGAKLNIEDLQSSLADIERQIKAIDAILAARENGFHHVHNIEVAIQLVSSLAENPVIGSRQAADQFLAKFREQASTLVHGARTAAALLGITKVRRGRNRLDWHDTFTDAVIHICAMNSIPKTIVTDRITGQPEGRFLEAALAFERLLKPEMRAPSAQALAQRLERSKQRLRARKKK